jgi:hypothetical protein
MCSTIIEYSFLIKDKPIERRKLRKLWQINKYSALKTKLDRAIKALKNLLESERNQEIQKYLSKLNPMIATSCCVWKATKRLKHPPTQHTSIRK